MIDCISDSRHQTEVFFFICLCLFVFKQGLSIQPGYLSSNSWCSSIGLLSGEIFLPAPLYPACILKLIKNWTKIGGNFENYD
jgi:hypothetical protein